MHVRTVVAASVGKNIGLWGEKTEFQIVLKAPVPNASAEVGAKSPDGTKGHAVLAQAVQH